jgi:hypothetical protein
MRFNLDFKTWGAWLLVALMLVLSLYYLRAPERQLFGAQIAQWAQGSPTGANLEAQTQMLTDGRPLIEYDGLNFLGCDLALHQGQAELITYWKGIRPEVNYTAQLRVQIYSTEGVVEYAQPITTSTLYWPLPKDYYFEMQRGDIWLRLVQSPSGDSIQPLWAWSHAAADDWLPICAS